MKKSIKVRDLIENSYESSEIIHRRMWEDISKMLEFVKDGKSTPKIEEQIYQYCVIRAVSGIEVFLKSLLSELISEHDAEHDRIVEEYINFQNMENIDKIFSKILPNSSLFTILRKISDQKMFEISIDDKEYCFDWPLFNKLLTTRHELIHNMSSPKLTFENICKLFYCAELFVSYVDSITHDAIVKPKQANEP